MLSLAPLNAEARIGRDKAVRCRDCGIKAAIMAADDVAERIEISSNAMTGTAPGLRFSVCVLCASLCMFTGHLQAQSPLQQRVTGPSQPQQISSSGTSASQSSAVTVNQQTAGSSGGDANVIDTQINVQGPYAGSVPTGRLQTGSMQLTLAAALSMAMKANLGLITQSAGVEQAQGQREVARSQLLPKINIGGTEEFERLNLRSQGVETSMFPVGVTFNFYDARVLLNQSVLDFVRINDLHAASASARASIEAARNARDLIVLATGGSYLQVSMLKARVDAEAAQVKTAQAIYQQADDRFHAGLAARIDVTRSQVQLQTEQQRLRSLRADLETEKLTLARIIGLPLGQQFMTAGEDEYHALQGFSLDTALDRAMQHRSDLRSAMYRVRAAESSTKAARAERLPSLSLDGDFGAAGRTPTNSSIGVYTAAATVTVPVFEGGRIRGEIEQANAALKQRKAEYESVRGQIDQEVRTAMIRLDAVDDQVKLARSNRDLARDTLTQSTDRFTAGVTDTVEVVQAEQASVQADDDLISAIFEHNVAKLSLGRAMGDAEEILPQLLEK